jgi:hypothetical protein
METRVCSQFSHSYWHIQGTRPRSPIQGDGEIGRFPVSTVGVNQPSPRL